METCFAFKDRMYSFEDPVAYYDWTIPKLISALEKNGYANKIVKGKFCAALFATKDNIDTLICVFAEFTTLQEIMITCQDGRKPKKRLGNDDLVKEHLNRVSKIVQLFTENNSDNYDIKKMTEEQWRKYMSHSNNRSKA